MALTTHVSISMASDTKREGRAYGIIEIKQCQRRVDVLSTVSCKAVEVDCKDGRFARFHIPLRPHLIALLILETRPWLCQ